jgi:hypothetical protein
MKLLRGLLVAAGASTLLACASQAPTTSSAAGTRAIPEGYRRVIVNGEERFCRTDTEPGSRVKKDTVCLTRDELDAQRDSTRDFMNNLSRQGGTYTGSGGNMGGNMRGPY